MVILETYLLVYAAILLLCIYAALLAITQKQKYASIPEAKPRLPFFGNARSLDLSRCHQILAEWALKFGPVYRIKVFTEEILVLNSYESVQEALVTRGAAFAGRPSMYRTARQARHRHSVVWQTYTPKLQFLRREVTQSLKVFGGGLDLLEQKCAPEIHHMIERIHAKAKSEEPFDPWDMVYDAISNVMLGLTLDTTYDHASETFKTIKEINRLFNDTFGTGNARYMDFLPWICKVGCSDYANRLQMALELRDQFWDAQLKLLKARGSSESVVQRLLNIASRSKGQEHDITEATAKEVFTNLILAGTDTTATALTCLLLVFLHHPKVQDKMRAELCDHVSLSDRAHAPYTQAVLLELLRYTSHVPLAVPHETTCDTSVLGIAVPKDMTVYINLWSVHHDSRHWPEPWTFNPSRFLDDEGNLLPPSHHIRRKLMVFGAGRRVCLGEALAKNRLFLFAAALVQHFHFLPSDEDTATNSLPPMDPRTYEMGLVLHPQKFRVKAVPVN